MWLCCSRSTLSVFLLFVPFSFCNQWTGRLLLTAWTWSVELSSPGAKSRTLRVWTPEVPLPKYSYAFWTTFVSQTDICLLWFCSLVWLPKSLFVPLYSQWNKQQKNMHRIHIKVSSIYSFNSFQCIQKGREASQSHLPFSLTNKGNFLVCIPEDVLVSSDCEVFTVFIFYQGWS